MGFKKVYTFYKWKINKQLINILLYKMTTNSHIFWPIFVYRDQSIQVCELKFTMMQTIQDSNHKMFFLKKFDYEAKIPKIYLARKATFGYNLMCSFPQSKGDFASKPKFITQW